MKMAELKPMDAKSRERRKVVMAALEKQLTSGKKPNKFGTTKEKKDTPYIPLTDSDIQRIKREIEILKTRI